MEMHALLIRIIISRQLAITYLWLLLSKTRYEITLDDFLDSFSIVNAFDLSVARPVPFLSAWSVLER